MADMQYRELPHGGEKISVIGLGMGSIHEGSEAEIEETLKLALASGVNYFDMAASEAKPYPCYARAFEGKREQVYLQMHFGAVYDSGKYGWTRDLKKIRKTFEGQLSMLHTDYTDMGFVHCIDEMSDYEKIMSGGIWDYMKSLKENGVIRHLGLSSHDPEIIRRFLDTGLIDMVMFSINPAYDYSVIGQFTPQNADGICVYCNHCQPCPKGLNVGMINKYYDLALAGDEMAKGHYDKLEVKAGECIQCGHCESRCPFHVKQETRMQEIRRYFGE